MTVRRRVGALALAALAVGLAASWFVGGRLLAPAQRDVAPPPDGAEVFTVPSDSGATLFGWWVPAVGAQRGTVCLLHPLRGDRRAMLGRARFLVEAGYSALLVDLQAHGESQGGALTAGWRERHDAAAAVREARRRAPHAPLVAIGWSLGGAALLLAHPDDLEPGTLDAVVLESVYPTLTEAIHDRIALRLGPLAHALTPLLTAQLPLRLGVVAGEVSPIDHIATLGCPVLVLSGTDDAHTPEDETRRLFAAAREPKALHLVEGAAHVDLHAYDEPKYEERVLEFLESALSDR